MRLSYNKKTADKVKKRIKNKVKIRKKVAGTPERPRLSVFRSGRHIYAQLIDDVQGHTLASASTRKKGTKGTKANLDSAKNIGQEIAKKAIDKNINNVVFDRSGYLYHGRIKSVAEGAREAGLKF